MQVQNFKKGRVMEATKSRLKIKVTPELDKFRHIEVLMPSSVKENGLYNHILLLTQIQTKISKEESDRNPNSTKAKNEKIKATTLEAIYWYMDINCQDKATRNAHIECIKERIAADLDLLKE